MYTLIHKYTDKMLYVDVLIGQHGTSFNASHDGDIPLIHSNCNQFKRILNRTYPEYEHSYQYPCMDDVDIDNYEMRRIYLSSEELIMEEDA